MGACCPTCGRSLAAPRARKVETFVPVADTSQMSDKELYAHYKKTAHLGDVAFLLAHATMSGALRVRVADLCARAPHMTRADCLRELVALQADWRRERNAADLAEYIAAGKVYDRKYSTWVTPEQLTARESEAVA